MSGTYSAPSYQKRAAFEALHATRLRRTVAENHRYRVIRGIQRLTKKPCIGRFSVCVIRKVILYAELRRKADSRCATNQYIGADHVQGEVYIEAKGCTIRKNE